MSRQAVRSNWTQSPSRPRVPVNVNSLNEHEYAKYYISALSSSPGGGDDQTIEKEPALPHVQRFDRQEGISMAELLATSTGCFTCLPQYRGPLFSPKRWPQCSTTFHPNECRNTCSVLDLDNCFKCLFLLLRAAQQSIKLINGVEDFQRRSRKLEMLRFN